MAEAETSGSTRASWARALAVLGLLGLAPLVEDRASGASGASGATARVAATSIEQVTVAPAVEGMPTPVTVRLGPGTTDPAVLDVIVGFAPVSVVAFGDDGTGGDPAAGDGNLTALIPAQAAGTLVRHRVRVGAGDEEVVFPVKEGKRRYDGFVVERPAVVTELPVLDWYLSSADAAWLADNRTSKEYVSSVLVVDGRVIDGAEVRNQGGFTAQQSPKPNYKVKLPGDQVLEAPFFSEPVDEFVIDADFEDPTAAIGRTAWRLFGEAGVPVRQTSTARVERDGAFYGVYQLYQESDGTWLDQLPYAIESFYEGEPSRTDLIDEGDPALLESRWVQAEGDGSTADLHALVEAVDESAGPQRADAVVDRFDVPRLIDLLALSALLQHGDAANTNLDLIHGADGRWRVLPNDLDLTFGLRGRTRLGDLRPRPLMGVTSELLSDGELAQLVARRIRTIYEETFADGAILADVEARVAAMEEDLALDRATWPLALPAPDVGVADLADFLAGQRELVADWTARGLLPAAAEGEVRISELAAEGAGDFVELANPDPLRSVDLSGWSLSGAATTELPGGTVLAPLGRLVVPRSPAAVAALGRGVLVSGELGSDLPAGGGTLVVRDRSGAARDQVTWSSGGGWPAPGSSGRTLEALALGASRTSGSGWTLSAAPGGTPGAAGASAAGLSVQVTEAVPYTAGAGPVPVRIVVRNAGPASRTAVVLDGPSADCDRSLPVLAAGAAHVVFCEGPSRATTGVDSLRAVVRSAEQPDGTVDSPYLHRIVPGPGPAAPVTTQVRLGAGTLEVGYVADPIDSEARWDRLWRVEGRFAPTGPAPVAGAVLDAASPAAMAAPVGVAGRVRTVARTPVALTAASGWSPVVTPRASEVWPFASADALIDRWYRDLGGRPSTAAERATWRHAFAGSGDPAALAVSLLASPRWTQDVDPLVRTYLAHFGRLPDPTGFDYWVARRRSGVTLARINAQFAGSAEFQRRYGGRTTAQLVAAVYQNVFGRAPDPSGLGYWTRRLDTGTPVATVVLAFSESSEGIRRKQPTVAPIVTWYAFHHTLPDSDWRTEATAWLVAGGDRGTIVESARSDAAYAP